MDQTANLFDASKHGVPSHFSEALRGRIKRLILEDLSAAEVKLPTYMKLLARYIAPLGVGEDWLSKLRHQTMASMLSGQSEPRYPFWACLFLYLTKKHGPSCLGGERSSYAALGEALAGFAGVQDAPPEMTTSKGSEEVTLIQVYDAHYARMTLSRVSQEASTDPIRLEIRQSLTGVCVLQNELLIGTLRDVHTRRIVQVSFDLEGETA